MSELFDFEKTLAELEKLTAELDSDVKLERALELFERGMKLSSQCEIFLKSAEQKVEILRRTASGIIAEPFEPAPTPVAAAATTAD